MELAVVPEGPFDPCLPPLCLDLRGWVVDDNNGYHGAGGVAQGAARFADHPLWACVPIGTIILIYNGGDRNVSLPTTDDLSLADGNCSIVLAVDRPGYFDRTGTTPPPVLCGDPGGWSPASPNWLGCMALANTGDCARVADPSGCEVFSLCYGSTTLNATVAFGGGGGQRVWWFNSGGDPLSAANWSFGCAGAGSCTGNYQTPGAPNSAANAAWLAVLNNNCTPISIDPVQADASGTDACGGCNGSVMAVGSGSPSGYTFAWYDASWAPIGQNTAAASALCPGLYHVIVSSLVGCSDTASVQIGTLAPPDAGTDAQIALCPGDAPVALSGLLGPSAQPGGIWNPAVPGGMFDPAVHAAGAYTYSVAGVAPCPTASATVTVQLASLPQIAVQIEEVSCNGSSDGRITVEALPAGPHTFVWGGGLPDGPVVAGLPEGTYMVEVTNAQGCPATRTIVLSAPSALVPSVISAPAICANGTGEACVQASGGTAPYTFLWDDPAQQPAACATGLRPGGYIATVADANGCTGTITVQLDAIALPDAGTDAEITLCPDGPPVDLFGLLGPSAQPGGTWSPVLPGSSFFDPESDQGGTYTYTVAGNGACPPDEAVVEVSVIATPAIMAQVSPISCWGLADASIRIEVEPPATYTITWSGGLPDGPLQTALPVGEWTVNVTGVEGCSASATVTVEEPEQPILTTTSTPARCGVANGMCCVVVEGMTAPYAVQWDHPGAQQGDCATGLAASSYTATVIDAQGCTARTMVTVAEQGGNFSVSSTVQDVRCAGEATGSIALTMDPPDSYVVSWTGPEGYEATGAGINELEAGDYTYRVLDPIGCVVSSIAGVDEPEALSFATVGMPTTCADVCDGRIEPFAGGGTAPWRSILQGDTLPLSTIDGQCAGVHVITLIDAAGCRLSSEVVIEEGTAPVVPSLSPVGPFCEYDGVVQLVADPPGGSWSGPGVTDATSGLFDPAMAGGGVWTVDYVLTSACSGSATMDIIVDPSPTAQITLPTGPDMPVFSNSLNADRVQWWVDGVDMGDDERVILLEQEAGAPSLVCLTAYSIEGCSDTLCTLFTIPTPFLVHVPNVFTPNGDDVNDEFLVVLNGPRWRSCTIDIYDRWGRTVFTAMDPSMGWDGTSGGVEAPIGVYPWRITLSTATEERVLQGHVSLVR